MARKLYSSWSSLKLGAPPVNTMGEYIDDILMTDGKNDLESIKQIVTLFFLHLSYPYCFETYTLGKDQP